MIRALLRADWDCARGVWPDMYLEAMGWEYARTFYGSAAMLEQLPQTGMVRWLLLLRSRIPPRAYLRKPWVQVIASQKRMAARMAAKVSIELPDGWKAIAPPGCVQAVTLHQDTKADQLTLNIDLTVDFDAIMEQARPIIYVAHQLRAQVLLWDAPKEVVGPGRGKANQWKKALTAIGTYRLKTAGYSYGLIAKLRIKHGWRASELTLKRAARRHMDVVEEVRKLLFTAEPL